MSERAAAGGIGSHVGAVQTGRPPVPCHPRRTLGVFSLTCLGLNSVIGSGIFLSPGEIAQHLGPWAPFAFLVGGLLIFPIGLCFCEMAREEQSTGGAFRYATRAFGPEAGFLVGWVIWLSGLVGGASVAVGLGHVLCDLGGWTGMEGVVGCLTAVVFALVNLRGTRSGALSNNLLAVTKLIPLLAFAVWALVQVGPARMAAPPAAPDFQLALAPGLLAILYTFSGFEEVPLPAGEVENPESTVPRAMVLVLAFSTLFYCVIQGAVSGLGLAGNATPLRAASEGVPLLGPAIVVASLLSLLSVNASIAFTAPRSLWALAVEGWLPSALSALSAKRQVPARCILINSALTLALCCTTFERLAQMSVLAALAQHLVTTVAAWKGRGFSLRPNVPLLATLICLGLMHFCSWSDLLGLGELMLGGWVLSRVYRRFAQSS